MTHGNWLELIDGSQYWLNNDRNDPDGMRFTLPIEKLAHQLSQINRFNGATRWPYSVAQHSVWVSMQLDVDAEWALAGLMHDAHEVIISDVARPVKLELKHRGAGQILDDLANEADARIFPAFAVALPSAQTAAIVRHVDDVALATERRDLMVGEHPFSQLPPPHPTKLRMMQPAGAARAFVERFHELKGRLGEPDGSEGSGERDLADIAEMAVPAARRVLVAAPAEGRC